MVDTSFSNPLLFHESLDLPARSPGQINPLVSDLDNHIQFLTASQMRKPHHAIQLEATGLYGQSPRDRVATHLQMSPQRFALKTPDPEMLDKNWQGYNQQLEAMRQSNNRSNLTNFRNDNNASPLNLEDKAQMQMAGGKKISKTPGELQKQKELDDLNRVLQPVEYNPTEEDYKSYRGAGPYEFQAFVAPNYKQYIEQQNQMLVKNRAHSPNQLLQNPPNQQQLYNQPPLLNQNFPAQLNNIPLSIQENSKFANYQRHLLSQIQQPPPHVPRKAGANITLDPFDQKIQQALDAQIYQTQVLIPNQSPWYEQNLIDQYGRPADLPISYGQPTGIHYFPQNQEQTQSLDFKQRLLEQQRLIQYNINSQQAQLANQGNQGINTGDNKEPQMDFSIRNAWQTSQQLAKEQFQPVQSITIPNPSIQQQNPIFPAPQLYSNPVQFHPSQAQQIPPIHNPNVYSQFSTPSPTPPLHTLTHNIPFKSVNIFTEDEKRMLIKTFAKQVKAQEHIKATQLEQEKLEFQMKLQREMEEANQREMERQRVEQEQRMLKSLQEVKQERIYRQEQLKTKGIRI